ncbi:MAG: hypothetical protein HOP29_17715 [Phycisphaerales bacterium]|nr:hypothetical protein [Phycisphaerales bacterium]
MPSTDSSLPPAGSNLRQAFESLVTTFDERGIRYAITGGLAVVQHTRPRTTDDVDALLTVTQVEMPALFDALRCRGFTVDFAERLREFRDDGITTILFKNVIVDLLRPVIPAYSHVLDRAVTANILGRQVRIGSAERLVVLKLAAMRPQDEADIQDLLAAYGNRLDLEFIRAELDTFADPNGPTREKFETWVKQFAG